nr:transmembrane protein 87A [Ipomoea batatas]
MYARSATDERGRRRAFVEGAEPIDAPPATQGAVDSWKLLKRETPVVRKRVFVCPEPIYIKFLCLYGEQNNITFLCNGGERACWNTQRRAGVDWAVEARAAAVEAPPPPPDLSELNISLSSPRERQDFFESLLNVGEIDMQERGMNWSSSRQLNRHAGMGVDEDDVTFASVKASEYVGTINDVSGKARVFLVLLDAFLDAFFILWVFTSLSRTLEQLQAKRSSVKLDLYRQFSNALEVTIIASVAWIGYEDIIAFNLHCYVSSVSYGHHLRDPKGMPTQMGKVCKESLRGDIRLVKIERKEGRMETSDGEDEPEDG